MSYERPRAETDPTPKIWFGPSSSSTDLSIDLFSIGRRDGTFGTGPSSSMGWQPRVDGQKKTSPRPVDTELLYDGPRTLRLSGNIFPDFPRRENWDKIRDGTVRVSHTGFRQFTGSVEQRPLILPHKRITLSLMEENLPSFLHHTHTRVFR